MSHKAKNSLGGRVSLGGDSWIRVSFHSAVVSVERHSVQGQKVLVGCRSVKSQKYSDILSNLIRSPCWSKIASFYTSPRRFFLPRKMTVRALYCLHNYKLFFSKALARKTIAQGALAKYWAPSYCLFDFCYSAAYRQAPSYCAHSRRPPHFILKYIKITIS